MTLLVVALGICALMVATGCSAKASSNDDVATLSGDAGTTPGTAAPSGTDEDRLRAFSRCMRENGMPDFPDPSVDANGRVRVQPQTGNIDRSSQAFQDANKACSSLRQGIGTGFSAEDRLKLQDAALKYAVCLRGQGLTVKDPDLSQPPTDGPGSGAGGQGGGGQVANGGQGGDPNNGGQGGRGFRFLARALGIDPSDPAVQAAQTACQSTLEQAMADAGVNLPGGGGGAPRAGN